MVIALSAESACVAVDVVELKIVVPGPLDGGTFVLYLPWLGRPSVWLNLQLLSLRWAFDIGSPCNMHGMGSTGNPFVREV